MPELDERFAEYLTLFRSRVTERSIEATDDAAQAPSLGFREDAFTSVFLDTLQDLGQVGDPEVAYVDRKLGRTLVKANAWAADEEGQHLDLFTTVFRDSLEIGRVTTTELNQSLVRATRIVELAGKAVHENMEPASKVYDMFARLHEVLPELKRIRVTLLVDGLAADLGKPPANVDGRELQVDVWDLQRLFRAESSGLPYEPIEIDLVRRLGEPLACLAVPQGEADYDSYLAIIPGDLLHQLYHEFDARLLELNVRSFLQARGKVNRGIRDTLTKEPARFLAYNNGISATAEKIRLVDHPSGGLGIASMTGLQVVNGGQTVASIHRAKQRDGVDLSQVFVQAKLTQVTADHVETLVPLISRYANTQNRVNEADFSANHPFHVRIQQLANSTWTPGEQSRWFYERARGQYQVARSREGTTPARLRRFDQMIPSRQKFDKVALAKYSNSWEQVPHIVSKGGQKNFVHFMQLLSKAHAGTWEADEEYFKQLVAKAIIFKRAEKIARQHKFPAYRANAIAYTVAMLSFRTAGRIDLGAVWSGQDVSGAIADTLWEWMPEIHEELVESAEGRNVTEWCKKEECWRHIQTQRLTVSVALEDELVAGTKLPTVGSREGRSGTGLTPADREAIARIMQVSAEEWIHLAKWAAQSDRVKPWLTGLAASLAGYAAANWSDVPSKKQAGHALKILVAAEEEGVRLSQLEED